MLTSKILSVNKKEEAETVGMLTGDNISRGHSKIGSKMTVSTTEAM